MMERPIDNRPMAQIPAAPRELPHHNGQPVIVRLDNIEADQEDALRWLVSENNSLRTRVLQLEDRFFGEQPETAMPSPVPPPAILRVMQKQPPGY